LLPFFWEPSKRKGIGKRKPITTTGYRAIFRVILGRSAQKLCFLSPRRQAALLGANPWQQAGNNGRQLMRSVTETNSWQPSVMKTRPWPAQRSPQ